MQRRLQNSGEEIRTVTNGCGISSRGTFNVFTSQITKFRKNFQFCFKYIQSHICFEIAKLRFKKIFSFTQVISKLPPNKKVLWSLHSVQRHWRQPTVLDFNDWLLDMNLCLSVRFSRDLKITIRLVFHESPTKFCCCNKNGKNDPLLVPRV